MAQVDTSIYGNMLRPVKSVQEYDQEAQQAEGNKLGLLLQRGQYDAQQRGFADDNAFRDVAKTFGNDTQANYQALMQRGLPKQAAAYQENALKGRESLGKIQGQETSNRAAEFKLQQEKTQQHLQQLVGVNSVQSAHQWLDEAAASGELPADKVAMVKQQIAQNPAMLDQWRQQAMMGGLTVLQQRQDEAKRIDQAEAARNNKAQNAATLRGQDITMRGQNMTDSRARDFNAVQVEANNIKRGEKKDIADMTKNSQVASFDTMLGTLDRLGKHPGLSRSVGMIGALPTMPGSDSANFQAELNTFQSQAFLPMVAQLKGMGALSDAEGKKLTAAVGALDPKMGEQAFRDSVARITADMEAARTRVAGQPRAGGASGDWGGAASKGPKAGMVDGGYRFKGGNPADKSNWEKVQ